MHRLDPWAIPLVARYEFLTEVHRVARGSTISTGVDSAALLGAVSEPLGRGGERRVKPRVLGEGSLEGRGIGEE